MKNAHVNLPEFIQFQSDHLVLTPKLISYSFTDRIRSSSTLQTSKPNRPTFLTQITTTTTNFTLQSPSKRLARSRHSYDTVMYHEKQHRERYSLRPTLTKFDSMSCFQEVSRLEILSPFFYFYFVCLVHSCTQ